MSEQATKPPIHWNWTPSEKAITKLGFLSALIYGGRICVDIYGANPLEKDNEPLCREVARKLDTHAGLLAMCERMLSFGEVAVRAGLSGFKPAAEDEIVRNHTDLVALRAIIAEAKAAVPA